MNEKQIIELIKNCLLDAECPHIQANEDREQIKSLLLEESSHKVELVRWIIEHLTDLHEFSDDTEALNALGLNLKTLKGWEMVVKLIKSKKIYASSTDELRFARHYTDFLIDKDLAQPVQDILAKSSLIPRDIEKDVLSRPSKNEDLDLVGMSNEDTKGLKEALLNDCLSKQDKLENLKEAFETKSDIEIFSENADEVLQDMKKYNDDFEQDFKPWTDRVEAPQINLTLENQIDELYQDLFVIKKQLEANTELRKTALEISEVLHELK